MEQDIDDSLYSRQRYLLGDAAMKQMAKSNVFLFGAGGLGIEIAKNIVLAGVKSLTLADVNSASTYDLGTQFFLSVDDVKARRNRAEVSVKHLTELNPYVNVKAANTALSPDMDLSFLAEYSCVILTETSLAVARRVNDFCRNQRPCIKFLYGDVKGVFCWAFCDFGDAFDVSDATGEEPKEVLVGDISKSNPGIVTTLEGRRHGLDTGDIIIFKEVKGMTSLNGALVTVNKVLSPFAFEISDTSLLAPYEGDGQFVSVKTTKTFNFEPLSKQLASPALLMCDLEFEKLTSPANIHLALRSLDEFVSRTGRLPASDSEEDFNLFNKLVHELNDSVLQPKVDPVNTGLLQCLSLTCQGTFAPLCAFLGGVLAQEALIGTTGKFSPLHQWLCLDASEVVKRDNKAAYLPRGDRLDALRQCMGHDTCEALAALHLFMVGCGAIGCELLKNLALLGVGTSGLVTVTDNDLIEKSNLNRQFLFRPQHIRQPKSVIAAKSAALINPDMTIEALQHKVCPETETTIFTDTFFERQHIVVNALDNIEARRYMDSRCVTAQRALLESGTMGVKGHVQVIVPHLTESYSTQRDPVDGEDVPFCTLKSFPSNMEHCIQWARDKFESLFSHKPSLYNKFWTNFKSMEQLLEVLSQGDNMEGLVTVNKYVVRRPHTWQDCVTLARLKLEKYFSHRAQQLLHSFPLDTRNKDGTLFWQSPKRPPTPVVFDANDQTHVMFVTSCARLFADMFNVPRTEQDVQPESVRKAVGSVHVPPFKPSSKAIETDESKKKETESGASTDVIHDARMSLHHQLTSGAKVPLTLATQSFEKDDDTNDHINFIAAAANLRAAMYNIAPTDRLAVKKIAGRIVPAIATTTAAVAGLVCVELIKVIQKAPVEHLKNCFLNLALPVIVFSEPGRAPATVMSTGVSFTQWDRWDIRGNDSMTLTQFMQELQRLYKVQPSAICQGAKMVYISAMPGHNKRLTQPVVKLIKLPADRPYVDLVISCSAAKEGDDDEAGPTVRYYFK